MELSKQVTSLDLSKKLKELGMKQESEFVWYEANHSILKSDIGKLFWNLSHKYNDSARNNPRISAFTVAELGKILMRLPARDSNGELQTIIFQNSKCNDDDCDCGATENFTVEYKVGQNIKHVEMSYPQKGEKEPTEAEARGQMVAYLVENKIIEL